MDCSTPDFLVHCQLLELAQTHVRQVSDAIQPSHPLPSPSPPAFSLSQHQGLFQRVGSSHQMAKGLEFHVIDSPSNEYSELISFRMDWISLQYKGLSRISPTLQFKSIISVVLSFLYSPTLTSIHDHWKNQIFDLMNLCWQSNVSAF